jgi:hypothetical protein
MQKINKCPTCGRRQQRNHEQNRLYWAVLHQIADQLKPQGQAYSSEQWHEYFKQRYLGAEDVSLPNGKVVVRTRSTTDLDVDEMTDYITRVEVWAVEHGIVDND